MLVAIVIPFALTVFWGRTHLSADVLYGQAQPEAGLTAQQVEQDVVLNAPMSGTLLPLSEIEDQGR